MHLVYVLLPVGPPFSTGVERMRGFRVFSGISRRQWTNFFSWPLRGYGLRRGLRTSHGCVKR